ncbi:MAG TPA: prepilin peptidase, partial [Candidatus Binataceae bacterium]|nr:prepilin peptidase [Candidatus Binataceae bacterium]
CAACHRPLPGWANVPLVSYLLLRGRCGACRAPIGFRAFLIELTLATIALYLYLHFPLPDAIARLVFCALLLVVGLIDFDWRVMPDVWPLIPLAMLAAWWILPEVGWRDSALGLVVGGGLPIAVAAAYKLLRRETGLAAADISLAALSGAFLGWFGALFTICGGALIGVIGGLALALDGWRPAEQHLPQPVAEAYAPEGLDLARESRRPLMRTAVPFAPFLALAAGVYALFQPQLVQWYFGG